MVNSCGASRADSEDCTWGIPGPSGTFIGYESASCKDLDNVLIGVLLMLLGFTTGEEHATMKNSSKLQPAEMPAPLMNNCNIDDFLNGDVATNDIFDYSQLSHNKTI